MMRVLFFLVLFSPTYAFAVFSSHEYIASTPEISKRFSSHTAHITASPNSPKILVEKNANGAYFISLSNLYKSVILLKSSDTEGRKNFRSHIWKEKTDPNILFEKIIYDRNIERSSRKGGTAKITIDTLEGHYLHIDFLKPVFDGGYYYTIDLSRLSK